MVEYRYDRARKNERLRILYARFHLDLRIATANGNANLWIAFGMAFDSKGEKESVPYSSLCAVFALLKSVN